MASLESVDSASATLEAQPEVSQSWRARLERRAVQLLALVITAAAALFCFFSVRQQSFDDLHLVNISYMYAHHSELSYPAHWQYQALTLHPPLHHLEMGLLMKMGLSPYYAEAIPVVLFFILGIYVVLASPFPTNVKIALLLAFCVPFLNVAFVPRARPDLHRALAMYVGLIALESGRLANWNWKRLLLGSALLTYASVLHYPGFLTWTGVAVYMVWTVAKRGWRQSRDALLAMTAGGLAVGIPFLLFFVAPNWHDIIRVIREVDPMGGGIASSLQVHFEVYGGLYSHPHAVVALNKFWPTRILFFPMALAIPVILIAAATLGMNRATRGIALAALPYPLFLLLKVPNHKIYWLGYFLPELMLYLAGVALLILWLLSLAGQKMGMKSGWALGPIAGLAMVIGLLCSSAIPQITKLSIKPQYYEDAVARAAGRAILGADAVVGSRSAIMWYASGGTYYYSVDRDLLWGRDLPVSLRDYFSRFDAIVEHQPDSAITLNDQKKSLISWYADGTLHLRGMYLTHDTTLPHLFLTPHRTEQVQGYALQGTGEVAHFRQQPNAEYTFATAICKQESPPAVTVPLIYRHAFLMPRRPGLPTEQMETYVFKTADFIIARPAIANACRLRDEISLSAELMEPRQLLARLKDDQVVKFLEHYDEVLKLRTQPPRQP